MQARATAALALTLVLSPAAHSLISASFFAPRATRTSAGVYATSSIDNRTTLVRTLWSRRETASGVQSLEWDGLDDEGARFDAPPGAVLTARVLDVGGVSYAWEGVVGNSVAQTGPRVPKGYNPPMSLAITGDVAVLCAGYSERVRGMFAFNASASSAASSFRSLGHMDYHSVYDFCGTDGSTAVFFNNGVPAAKPSYYSDNATFAVGYDLHADFFDPSVPAVCEHNYTLGGRLSCQAGWNQNCSVLWDGCNGHEQTYSSAVDWHQSALLPDNSSYADAASGLAVQPAPGALLLVLHGAAGQLRALDKSSGALLRTWTEPATLLAGARSLAVASGGSGGGAAAAAALDSAWAVTDAGVCRFSGLGSDAPLTAACPIPRRGGGVLDVGAIAVSPDGTRLLVTDIDAAAQQVKLFDAASGALLRTYGRPGGYVAPGADIAVAPDRFWFSPSVAPGVSPRANSAVAFTADGASFWVTDLGNRRLLRLALADGAPLDALSWLLSSYASAAVSAAPERVFSNFLEFAVPDYAAPLAQASSWALVRNWGAGLGPEFVAWDFGTPLHRWAGGGFGGMASVWDAARGANRTFATVQYWPCAPANGTGETTAVVELVLPGSPAAAACPSAPVPGPGGGGLRLIHVWDRAAPGSLGTFEPADGSLRFAEAVDDAARGSFWQGIYARRPSFDADGCASWLAAPPALLASFNVSANASQSLMARGSMSTPRLPTSAGGFTAVFDASRDRNGGFHLGAVQAGAGSAPGTGLAWRASPWSKWRELDNVTTLQPGNVSVNLRYVDPADADGRFGGDDPSVNYAGSVVMAEGAHLVYGFYGEGWAQSEANQMLHWHESGLFIGQFGLPAAPYPEGNTIYAAAGVAGNTMFPSLLRARGAGGAEHLYVLHNEETEHGGVHRWRIDGADSVRDLAVAPLLLVPRRELN